MDTNKGKVGLLLVIGGLVIGEGSGQREGHEYGETVNRHQILDAVETGLPFVIRMADGREYEVPHRDFISVPPRGAFVIVYDVDSDEGRHTVLSMLTMTGIHRLPSRNTLREEPNGSDDSD